MRFHISGFVLMLLSASCGNKQEMATNSKASADSSAIHSTVSFSAGQLQTAGIETGFPQTEMISGTVTLQGKIEVPPQNTVSLSFPLGGYLKSTQLLPGMPVHRGQVLAVLEDMQFIQLQQDYLTAKERFNLAESEFSRQRELNASKASSDKVFEQTKAELETQRILVSALARKLEVIGINPVTLHAGNLSKQVSILSPINGFVSKVNVNVGKYTSPTDMLFELIDPRDVHLTLDVFEKDMQHLSIGQQVMAYTNNDPGKKYEATVILINKMLNLDRMAEVHCHFKKYTPTLVPGMFMNGEVALQSVQALTVPEAAVVRWENKFYVFTEQGAGQFTMTEVQPGVLQHGRQQIGADGITTKTRLVLKNAYAVLMKSKNTSED